MVKEGAQNGTVVITDNQTQGRGRQSNSWFSVPQKSLTFSVILYPNISAKKINFISLISGLAICDSLTENDVNARLKWPNDILINSKKVGGILCESKIKNGKLESLVIGIGLNINIEKDEVPLELKTTATSLFIEQNKLYDLEIILAGILNHLEKRLNEINDVESIISDWSNHCAHLNQPVKFHSGGKIIEGVFAGLSTTGQATLIIDDQEYYFDSGEII